MRIRKDNKAVSEIIGSVVLLAMAITIISVVYMQVLSEPGPSEKTYTTIVGKFEEGTVAFENQRGETLVPGAQIMLRIAGQQTPTITVGDEWNIGGKLYPVSNLGDLTGVQIDATIVDEKSNAMVFWGRLQEGYVVPPFGRGGIWHFNESWWDGTTDEVKDGSGNGNYGTAYNGANTTNNVVSTEANRSGYFDGIDDYVEVKNTYSLNITEAITVEAWVKPLQETSGIINKTVLEQLKFGYNPDLIHVYGNVYAIASLDKDCNVITFNISNDGIISTLDSSIPNNKSTFSSNGDNPDIIQHAVNTSLYAIVFENNSKGSISTIGISENGSIKSIKLDEKNFNQSSISNPIIIHVTGDVYAIAYRGSSGAGVLTTVNIASDGSISKLKDFTFNTTGCNMPSIINVSGDVYAIAYSSGAGVVTTVHISSDGTTISKISYFQFAPVCYEPKITRTSGGIYGLIYNKKGAGNTNGYLKTVEIEPNGYILDTLKPWEPETIDNQNPIKFFEPSDILHIDDGRVFAVAYRDGGVGHGHPGFLITMRIGEDPTPEYKRGVVRAGAATLYAEYPRDATMVNVLACLNGTEGDGISITTTVSPGVWHHIALSYDGSTMSLYVDGTTNPLLTKSLSKKLRIPQESFRFGNIFYGYLDEIAIFDHALSSQEIAIHADPLQGIWKFY